MTAFSDALAFLQNQMRPSAKTPLVQARNISYVSGNSSDADPILRAVQALNLGVTDTKGEWWAKSHSPLNPRYNLAVATTCVFRACRHCVAP